MEENKFKEILNKYGTYIYNYAMKLTLKPDDASDLAQDTFLKAWEKREQLQNLEAAGSWLRTICYNEFLMKIRKEKGDVVSYNDLEALEEQGKLLISIAPGPEDEVIVADEIKKLQNGCFYAMARRLSLSQRIAFSMVDMFGLTIAECADMLECTEGAVKGLLHRARMNLDAFFSGHCDLLDANNPCSCKAFLNFSQKHDCNQSKARENLEQLNVGKEWHFDPSTRKKIAYLYNSIPDSRPNDEWFENVIKFFK